MLPPSRALRAALALLALALAAPAGAQSTTSSLTGRVRDTSGAVLPGATVNARHVDTGLLRSAVTEIDGRYVIAGAPVGEWELKVEMSGFKPAKREGLRVVLGEPLVTDFQLELGSLQDEVTVTAEAPLVQTRSGEMSYLVSERAIRNLPLNGRNYTDLAYLQPGVVNYPHRDTGSVVAHGVGMSVNGQDPRSNAYLLDGTLLNDFTNGPAGSAAGTSLGTETIREFRVETNAYGAEFGRNAGGQVHAISKSGTNRFHGSAYEYFRNDALDAANYFDLPGQKPDFNRHQFGATIGGPIRKDKTFFFVGYEALRENLGRTISTSVPDDNARRGFLPDGNGGLRFVGVSPNVAPYLSAYPVANGASQGGGLAAYTFVFDQELVQDYFTARLDQNLGDHDQLFVRYTRDVADQYLPTDFPQFPRRFVSTNQFATGEYRRVQSDRTLHTFRLGYSSTRVGQEVEANVGLGEFVPGRGQMGGIDVGGIPGRFGPQTSVNVDLRQKVYAFEYGLTHNRGRHTFKAGLLTERYVDELFNPTFSLGIYVFPSLETFMRGTPVRFIGLTPEADLERLWKFWLMAGYVQDEWRVGSNLTLNLGLRWEATTQPADEQGRDSTLVTLQDPTPTSGVLYENPTWNNFSPRFSFAWDVTGDGRTSVRGGYGLYYNTNVQQNLIVTITNPPATPRAVIGNPTFPQPPFQRAVANTIRPMQYDLQTPRVHVWNVAVQREVIRNLSVTLGYAGSRGMNLYRSGDVNVPTPQLRDDGSVFWAAGLPRPNRNFGVIEQKTSDGDSWYNALIFEVKRRAARGLSFQSSYTFSRNIDTTQASTFFSDATNGTTSAFPEPYGIDYNRGLADYHAKHNWVFNVTWDLPIARGSRTWGGWQLAAIGQMKSGYPLTVFVANNRSRSQWGPSIGPGLGLDRPNLAPGRTPESAVTGNPDQWFDPMAFALQPAGTLGNAGRGAFIGPDLKTVDLALIKRFPVEIGGRDTSLEFRVEVFNVFNRANFGIPNLQAFTGTADNEAVLGTFGRIRNTVTSARQVQLGVRATF